MKGFLLDIESELASMVAKDLVGRLFKNMGGGGTGGFFSAVIGAFSSRDSGGRGQAGMPYAIGTGAQPEVFVPDTAGTFYPKGAGMGQTVHNNFTINAPAGTVSRATQAQVAAAASRGVDMARRRNT